MAPGTDPADGIPAAAVPDQDDLDAVRPVLREMQRIEALHALGHQPRLLAAVDAVLDEPFFRYPSTVHRLKFPSGKPTPPHPDWYFLQGSPDSLTAWVPFGDLDASAGGLAVLAGSHRRGLYWSDWKGTHDPDVRWHGGDFQAGDVLLFHALTVHASLPNTVTTVRASADYRYQPLRDPVHEAWMVPHFGVGTWDEIADGWTGPHARYWEGLPVTVITDREEDVERLVGRVRPRLFPLDRPPRAGDEGASR
ncbi:MAG: phytanoyl-CoA dioxygenase family protein [Actinobacteria bacterium]|nr:phytanoyl-CoA dioxygenase family protein [Actinomycetota bacterium]